MNVKTSAESQPEPPVQEQERHASPVARRRDWGLWFLAVLALAVLFAGWRQAADPRFGSRTWEERLLAPIEINPAARLPLLPEADLHAVWFFDGSEGLVAGESGTLLRTTDGGASWTRIAAGQTGQYEQTGFYALEFRSGNPEIGLLGGRDGALLRSENRGRNWTELIAPSPPDPVRPQTVAQKVPSAPAAGSGSDGSSSSWWLDDIRGLAFLGQGNSYYAARAAGVGTHQLNDSALAGSLIEADVRSVAWTGGRLAYAGSSGLVMRWMDPPLTPRELVRDGSYTGLAGRNGMLFAAGDRFRMEFFDEQIGVEKPRAEPGAKPAIQACALADDGTGWAVGDGGAVWQVRRGTLVAGGGPGLTVLRRDVPGFSEPLFAVMAFSANEALVVGKNGSIFRTRNGGGTWLPVARNCWPANQRASFHLKLPAPWCWLVLGLLGGLGWRRWQSLPVAVEERDAVAEELTSDRPLEPGEIDRLGFDPFVRGLSAYLRNTATQAPLTLAVTGAWGAGKSSFMNLLRADLGGRGLRTVWFNAWHHQQEPQILAPLLSAIQAEASPPLLSDKIDLALRFRGRLVAQRIRSQRSLLLGAAVLLCFAIGVGAALHWQLPAEALTDWWDALWTGKPEESVRGFVSGGSLLGTLAGLLLFVWRAMKTFGVSPSDLLATEAGKTSVQALSAQTAFRREFADQFGEVTEALKPYPLVIFIDDLDRCEVAKVFQILEAINYLVSNGACFVVLGMSEERVRDCVALGFKDLPPDFGENAPAPGEQPGANSDAWSRQRALAQNYLEKLVQLRIDVPRPDLEAARRLVRAEGAPAALEQAGWRPVLQAWWANNRFSVAVVLGVLLLLGGAFAAGRWVAPRVPLPATETVAGTSGAPAASAPTGALSAAVVGGAGSTEALHLYRERGLTPASPEPGREGAWGTVASGLAGLTALVGVWLAERLWQRRRSVIVKDSREFNEACERWTGALHRLQGEKLTPRSLKRFKNRVRYYAMMRAEGDGRGLLPGVSDAALVALGAIEQAGFMRPGQLDREDLELDRLMGAPIEESLKAQAVEAFGALKRDTEDGRTLRAAKKSLRRA